MLQIVLHDTMYQIITEEWYKYVLSVNIFVTILLVEYDLVGHERLSFKDICSAYLESNHIAIFQQHLLLVKIIL